VPITLIEIDGELPLKNAKATYDAGADVLGSRQLVFKSD